MKPLSGKMLLPTPLLLAGVLLVMRRDDLDEEGGPGESVMGGGGTDGEHTGRGAAV